jgi:hypothetical protein
MAAAYRSSAWRDRLVMAACFALRHGLDAARTVSQLMAANLADATGDQVGDLRSLALLMEGWMGSYGGQPHRSRQ